MKNLALLIALVFSLNSQAYLSGGNGSGGGGAVSSVNGQTGAVVLNSFGPLTVDDIRILQGTKADQLNGENTAGNTILGRRAGESIVNGTTSLYGMTLIGDMAGGSYAANAAGVTAVGWRACAFATGDSSTCLGYNAGGGQLQGSGNTWVGQNGGQACFLCNFNTSLGGGALYNITTGGEYDVGLGRYSLVLLTTGKYNTAAGDESCYDVTTGSGNICLGRQSGKGKGNTSNRLFIGNADGSLLVDGDMAAGTFDVIGKVGATTGVQLKTTGTQPTCVVGLRGTDWHVYSASGVDDLYQRCEKTAADTYEWVNH